MDGSDPESAETKFRPQRTPELFDMLRFAVALVLIMLAIFAAAERVAVSAGAQDSGEIHIVKIVCDGEGTPALLQVDSPEEAAKPPDRCVKDNDALPKGAFLIFGPPSHSLEKIIETDVETGLAIASLPPGDYEVVEDDGATVPPVIVTVESGETTHLQSVEYMERKAVDLCTGIMGAAELGGPDPLVENGPRLRWSIPVSTSASTIMAGEIGNNLIGFGLRSQGLAALVVVDTASGAESWCHALDRNLSTPPVVSDGVIVATVSRMEANDPGETIAFDGATGEERWRITPGLIQMAPGSAGDGVVVGFVHEGQQAELIAVDVASGRELWRYDPQVRWSHWSPAIGDDAVYVPAQFVEEMPAPATVALDLATGDERWRAEFDAVSGPLTNVSYSGGVLYAGGWLGESCCVVALDAETGEERWRSEAIAAEFSRPLVADGVVYVGGSPGFVALDAAWGDEIWRADLGGIENPVQSTAVLLNEQVLAIDPLGSGGAGEPDLVGLDAETGEERWRLPLGKQGELVSPVMAGDAVVIAGFGLLALEVD